MNFTKRPLSKHRRARLIAWTLAMLVWVARVLFTNAVCTPRQLRQRRLRMSLDWLTRRVKMLILVRAWDFAPQPRRRGRRACRGVAINAPGALRALVGVRVQRLLKRKHVAERIAVLIDALVRIDDYAKIIARRLKRGFTRRWRALFAIVPAANARVASLAAPEACFADSS